MKQHAYLSDFFHSDSQAYNMPLCLIQAQWYNKED